MQSRPVRNCLLEEAKAIQSTAEKIDPDQVQKALELLHNCFQKRSKIIITGVGKSGIVSRKIAATFSSIGLMSLYLNPLDALHGDLGIVSKDDVCILLSNSGETEEIISLLPHLKKRRISIIAIVGRKTSTLATSSDVYLDASVDREVCPLNLAPTASTAVAMAIGDALAVSWMEKENISSDDFAINHPSGSLGKKLTLRIFEVMIPLKKIHSLEPNTTFFEIISAITNDGIGSVCIVDPQNPKKLIGLITDGDLRRTLSSKMEEKWSEIKAEDFMSKDPITISPVALANSAFKIMEKNSKKSVSVLPVINEKDELLGILRMHDLIKCGLDG